MHVYFRFVQMNLDLDHDRVNERHFRPLVALLNLIENLKQAYSGMKGVIDSAVLLAFQKRLQVY